MDIDVKQRIKSVFDFYGESVNSISRNIGIAQTTLNRQLNTDAPMTLNNMLLIMSVFPDLSAEWLLHGSGNMIRSNTEVYTKEKEDTYIMSDKRRMEILQKENEMLTKMIQEADKKMKKIYEISKSFNGSANNVG